MVVNSSSKKNSTIDYDQIHHYIYNYVKQVVHVQSHGAQ